ncbi:hypothetical protein LUZ60_009506 [Juncus effusus]|nr:hypothetical protein LUZ60_009506 [Juncus effusus]
MSTYLLVPLYKSTHNFFYNFRNSHFKVSLFLIIILLLISFSLLFLKIFLFFLPLIVSTTACSIPIYLTLISEKQGTKEIIFHEGENPELASFQVFEEANSSVYKDRIEVGCFLKKYGERWTNSGVEEDGEKIIFAGRVEMKNGQGLFDEDLVSLKIDSMAAGLWDNYFGRWSKWNYDKMEILEEKK